MNAQTPPDFTIQRLGTPRFDSPMQLSHVKNDKIANFVDDSERILLTNSASVIDECIERGEKPLSFEAAGPRERIFFNPPEVKAAIVTCGGLCPGLNDVIQGIVHSLYFHYGVKKVLGIKYGYKGLTARSQLKPLELTPSSVEHLHTRGGTVLGSSRGPQPDKEIIDFLVIHGINVLFAIGGDGTQRGVIDLTREIEKRKLNISIIGIPKTIDNDIMYTDRSFGFETAYSIAREVMLSAHAEAQGAYNGIVIVKLMGRHSGFLAATASLASGEVNLTLTPEVPFDLEQPNGILPYLEERILRRHHAVVVVAEGAGQVLVNPEPHSEKTDASGNVKLADIGVFLHQQVKEYFARRELEAEVRYIDPSYIVRSLPTIPSDRMFCMELAFNAVHAAMSGRTGAIVGHWNSSFTHLPAEAATSQRKSLDPESDLWLSVLQATGQPNQMINK